MDQIKFAVIGAGFMGSLLTRIGHALPYARCVAVADVDQHRAQALAAPCDAKSYHDYQEMLEQEHPEAVIVATPEFSHREPAVKAARQGCHLFVEKPLATTLEDADAIIAACADARVILMTGYVLRFEYGYSMIKAAVDGGNIGRFLSAYGRRNVSISEARRLAGRVSPVTYIAVHDIDQFLWYHPVAVRAVSAKALRGRVWEELKTYDFAWITIEFEDGALAVEEVGWGLPETWAAWKTPTSWGGFGDVQMNVIGTQGTVNLNFTPMNIVACDQEGWKLPDTRHWPALNGKSAGAARMEVEHFFECIIRGEKPVVTGSDGRQSLEVMLAAERSITEGQNVELPL
ncbi:MAG TPA: Gfo/Idh/MocA family oxidoreductase [Aggregatilineaceae bacterium]|nr:Gfo/Idh/MocA family oxidoreductase [Aggregatilineaceae bacterium]